MPKAVQSALISHLKIIASFDVTERRIPQNGGITAQSGTRSVDLRLATLPTVWGEKIVLRVLDTGGIDLDLKNLGFGPKNFERFQNSFRKPHGLLLVTGPTGSGKSTTLYATLTRISRQQRSGRASAPGDPQQHRPLDQLSHAAGWERHREPRARRPAGGAETRARSKRAVSASDVLTVDCCI